MRQIVKSCFIFLTALEDQPDSVEAAGCQILFGDIEIDVPAVSEHQLEVTLLHGIQLEQQHPTVTGRFFRLLAEDAPFFLLKLRYRGDTLVEAVLNGAPVAL